MNHQEQKLISDVLNFAHLTSIPKKRDDSKSIWIEAVAKIRLSDNSIAYGIVKRNPDLSYRVAYINGAIATVVGLEEVYPFVLLDKQYIQKFGKDDTEKERIAYLKSLNLPYAMAQNYFDNMTIDELNKEVVKAAVYQQIKALEE